MASPDIQPTTIIERVARCEAEYHGSVYGTQCQLADKHIGPHWAITESLGVIIWNGDSRETLGSTAAVPQDRPTVELEACKHERTRMVGFTQVCDHGGQGRDIG